VIQEVLLVQRREVQEVLLVQRREIQEVLLTHKRTVQNILLARMNEVQGYERKLNFKATTHGEEPPQKVEAGGMRMIKNALWIPEHAIELQLRLCIEAHHRFAVHRVREATIRSIK
jgi:hypothetical protein